MSQLAIDGGIPVRSEQDSSPTHDFGEKKVIRDGGRDKPNVFKRIFSKFKN